MSVDEMDSSERNLKPFLDLSNPAYKEIFFLVAQFLSGTPCQRAAKALIEELEAHELIPNRLNWLGETTPQDFNSFSTQYGHIGPHHLPKLLELCVKAANGRSSTSVAVNKSLLSSSTLSFLSRASESDRSLVASSRHQSLISYRPSHGRRVHSTVHSLLDQSLHGTRIGPSRLQPVFFERLQLSCVTLGHLSAVYCVLFDVTGKYIFTGADDSLVKIWSAVDGRLLATLRGASSEITDLAVNPENTLLAAGSCDKLIRVWCLRTCAPVTVLNVHSGNVTSVFFCPIPRSRHSVSYLASTSTDGSCAFWGFTENEETGQITFHERPTHYQERMRPGHAQMVCSSFSTGGTFMAAGSADNNVRVYNMLGREGPERILEVEVHSDRVDSISWAHEGLRFISGSKDGTALVWRFENGEWRYVRLLCAKMPGSNIVVQEDPKRRPRVTMVSWNTNDTLVLTAVSDFLVKVWNPRNGELIRVLDAHQDEVYVIESHPFNPRLVCTAGHDGRLIIWDIGTLNKEEKGKKILDYHNKLDQGQGHGAVFDCKWAPDGLSLAATDSHGHLLIFTTQAKENSKFSRLPKELFFHTDYRPLTRDAMNNEVLDEQTQVLPHLMPPPFLVDMEGNPYPPALQRLVPGREICREEQLIPNVAVGNGGFQEVIEGIPTGNPLNPRSNIDQMIEQLAAEQGVAPEHRNGIPVPRLSGGPSDRERRVVGLRRSGDVEGVRQSTGNWQRGNYGFPERKVIMPLDKGSLCKSESNRHGHCEMEEIAYNSVSSRRPTGSGISPLISPSDGLISIREAAGRRVRRLPLEAAERRRQVENRPNMFELEGVARPNPPQQEISINQQGTRRPIPVNNRGAFPIATARRGGSRTNRSRYNIHRVFEQRGVQNESDIENMEMPSEEDTSDEDVSMSNSSSSSESESESDWGGAPRDAENRNKRNNNEGGRKSTRKNNAASPKSEDGNENEDDSDDEPKPGTSAGASAPKPEPKPKPKKAKAKSPDLQSGLYEIPPEFRPSEWLAELCPKRTPYFPQLGDEIVYYRQGHESYIAEVEKQKVYEITKKLRKTLPYVINPKLEAAVPARITSVKFDIGPPRCIILKLSVIDWETGELTGTNLMVQYHDMTNVVDFLILRQVHDRYIRQNWNVGDRFRCLIDRSWWVGTVESIEPKDNNFPESKFMCYNVVWDNTEIEKLSPWDMDIITDSFPLPAVRGQAVAASEEDIRFGLYEPSSTDWPPQGLVEARCIRISSLLEQVMGLAISEAFLTPVDINLYPNYCMTIEYPMDLSTIKARLDARFYRRADAVKFDAKFIAMNAEKFNRPDSDIVKHARIIRDLLLEIISNPEASDVNAAYHLIVKNYMKERETTQKNNQVGKSDKNAASTSRPASRSANTSQQPSTSRRSLRNQSRASPRSDDSDEENEENLDWTVRCRNLLETIQATKDAVPFRAPVNPEDYPNYYQIIDTPMDLQTVMEDLCGGNYSSPLDFHKDMNLIFSNSRQYNTDKRSQIYSMTIRLQSMYECQVKPILTSYRSRKKGSKVGTSPSKTQKKRSMPNRASSTTSSPRKNPSRNAAQKNPYLQNENGVSSEDEEGSNRRYSTRSHHDGAVPGTSSSSRRLRARSSTTTNTSSSTTTSRSLNGHSPRNGFSPPMSSRQARRVKRLRMSSGESLHSHRSNERGGSVQRNHHTRRNIAMASNTRGNVRRDEGSDEFEDSDENVQMPHLHAAGNASDDDDLDSDYHDHTHEGSSSRRRRSSRVRTQIGSRRATIYDEDYSYGTRFRGRQITNYAENQNGSSGEDDHYDRKRRRVSGRSEHSPPRKLRKQGPSPKKKNVIRDEDDEEDEEDEDEVVDPDQPGPSTRISTTGSRRSTRLSRNNEEDEDDDRDEEEEDSDGDEDEDDEEEEEEDEAEEGSSEDDKAKKKRRSSTRLRRKPSRHSFSDDENSSPSRSRKGSDHYSGGRTRRGIARPDYNEDSDSEHDVSVSSRGRVRRKKSFLG